MDFREDLGAACNSKFKFTENVQKSIQKTLPIGRFKKTLTKLKFTKRDKGVSHRILNLKSAKVAWILIFKKSIELGQILNLKFGEKLSLQCVI